MAELVYRSGSGGEERFILSKEVSSVGRDEDCDVILPDTSVSRRHALIYRVDERLYRVEDHNSSNGTRVNHETVVTEFLRDGDILEIGAYQLTFVNPVAGSRPAPRTPERELAPIATNIAPAPTPPAPMAALPAAPAKPKSQQRSATLLVLDSGKVVQEHAIVSDTTSIGSAPASDLVLDDSRVQGEHAQILYHDGAYFLEDLESSSGTFCNHERIISKELKSGDELSIGRHVLVFEVDDELDLSAAPAGRDGAQAKSKKALETPAPMELMSLGDSVRRGGKPEPAEPMTAPVGRALAILPPSAAPVAAPVQSPPSPTPASRVRSLADTVADVDTPLPVQEPAPAEPMSLAPVKPGPSGRRFSISFPSGRGTEAPLDKDEITLGRLPSNDIVLEDDSISRVHARVFVRRGQVTIHDQESLNGVQVGGRFVDKAELKDGDLLVLGEIRIEYHDGTARRAAAAGSGSGKSAYPETLYDTVEEDSSPRRADTLVDAEEPRSQAARGNTPPARGPAAPVRSSRESEAPREESGASRPAEDDSFRPAEDDSFRGNGGNLRDAETLYEAPSVFAMAADSEPSGPLDKLRGVYERLGPNPKQRRLRAVLGSLILLALVAMILVRPAPEQPVPVRPADQPMPVATAAAAPQSSLTSSQSDDARLARINKVHEASDAMQTQDWKRALELVEPVIVDEPSNTKALSIRETARQELEVQAKMASADELIRDGKLSAALEALRAVPPQSVYYSLAEKKRSEASKDVVDRWLSDAERARDAKRYEEAAGLVRRALETAPDSTRARALAQDIERRRKEPQRTGPSPEEVAAAKRAQEEADQAQTKKHSDATAAISAALQTYASGDAKTALESMGAALAPGGGLTDYDPIRKQSESQMELIQRVVQQSEAARRATESGRTDEALTAWKAVLEADRQLLGADRQSRFRQDAATPFAQLLTAQGDELYAAGQASGELAGAYQKYKEALSYVSGYGPARAKIEAIEKAAIDAYRLAYGRWETDKEAGLAGVEQVLKMLPPDHEYAHRATILRDKIRGR